MLWVKVFVVLCIVLDLTSSLSYYRRVTHRHRHRHVYKCGFQKCVRRKSPPVCNQWCLVYINVGYCQQPRYVCCSYKEKPGCCSSTQNVCAWPFPYYLTQAYQCQHDFNCPSEYKCCYDSCYVHKVCKPITNPQGTSTYPPKEGETTTSSLTVEGITTTTELTTTTVSTNTQEITTPTEESTTQEEITTATQEETTEEITTTHETTTQEETTEEVTTTQETTTPEQTTKEVTTTQKETTTSKMTTSETVSTTEKPITTTLISTTLRTTTIEEIEGSGFGSGDTEIPEPPAARFGDSRNSFGTFSDDEDFVNNLMDFN